MKKLLFQSMICLLMVRAAFGAEPGPWFVECRGDRALQGLDLPLWQLRAEYPVAADAVEVATEISFLSAAIPQCVERAVAVLKPEDKPKKVSDFARAYSRFEDVRTKFTDCIMPDLKRVPAVLEAHPHVTFVNFEAHAELSIQRVGADFDFTFLVQSPRPVGEPRVFYNTCGRDTATIAVRVVPRDPRSVIEVGYGDFRPRFRSDVWGRIPSEP